MIAVMVNGHAAQPGCYIAGHWGQYGPDRVADVAESFGWEAGHVRDDPRRLRRVAEWLVKRTPTEPFCGHCRRPLEYDRERQVWVAPADDRAACPPGEGHEPTWRTTNVWDFYVEAANDIVTWLNDHTALVCPHCGGAMYPTFDGFYRHVDFPSEASRLAQGEPCAFSAIDSPLFPRWEWVDGEFCLNLYDGESDEPLDPETLEVT